MMTNAIRACAMIDVLRDWELWHRDLFDRETPASIERKGKYLLCTRAFP